MPKPPPPTSRALPTSIVGSFAAIVADGVPVAFSDEPAAAAAFAERLLLKFHKRARYLSSALKLG